MNPLAGLKTRKTAAETKAFLDMAQAWIAGLDKSGGQDERRSGSGGHDTARRGQIIALGSSVNGGRGAAGVRPGIGLAPLHPAPGCGILESDTGPTGETCRPTRHRPLVPAERSPVSAPVWGDW